MNSSSTIADGLSPRIFLTFADSRAARGEGWNVMMTLVAGRDPAFATTCKLLVREEEKR